VPEFLYFLLVQLSLVALGGVLVTMGVLLRRRRIPYWWAYLGVKTGLLVNTGIILGLVIPNRIVRPGVLAYLYITGTAAIALFMIYVCRDIIRRSYQEKP
jgi:hypothetical protein